MAAPSRATVVLKAVKKITVQFCPFESNVRSIREFLVRVGSEKARSTNINCEVLTTVKHDQSDPLVEVIYVDGETLRMKAAKLTCKEMLDAFQSRCIAKDPQGKPGAKK